MFQALFMERKSFLNIDSFFDNFYFYLVFFFSFQFTSPSPLHLIYSEDGAIIVIIININQWIGLKLHQEKMGSATKQGITILLIL